MDRSHDPNADVLLETRDARDASRRVVIIHTVYRRQNLVTVSMLLRFQSSKWSQIKDMTSLLSLVDMMIF